MARLLADLIFIGIVRSHVLGESKGTRGWLRGLGNPGIARALQAIHQNSSADWKVASLAQVAGMSRTAFAVRFAALVEETPIDYLTRWRMHLAADRLLRSRPNLTQLAFDLGYSSDAAFRDAFKRRYGVAPSRYVADVQRRQSEREHFHRI
jgi:AraC-like DNA-binding protein